jgi:hypothetical protein
MRQTLRLTLLFVVGALASATAASATPPEAVALTFTMTATGPTTASGNWTATGDLAAVAGKSGTVTQTIRITGKGKGKGKKAGQVVHGTKTVTAGDGTFVIKFVGAMKSTGATTFTIDGRFVLRRGTGAYAGLRGTGKIHATLNIATGAIVATYTGKAHVHPS